MQKREIGRERGGKGGETDRKIETDRERDRQRQTETDSERDRQRQTERQRATSRDR